MTYHPDKGLKHYAHQLENHPNANEDDDYMIFLTREHFQVIDSMIRSPAFFIHALSELFALSNTAAKISLFEKACEHIPADFPSELLDIFMDQWQKTTLQVSTDLELDTFVESERTKLKREHAIKMNNGITPQPTGTHFYCQQQLLMAELYLKQNSEVYTARAISIVQSLPASPTKFFNPHSYSSHTYNLVKNFDSISNDKYQFQQNIFKARALLKVADGLPDNAGELLNQAIELIQKITFNEEGESFNELEDKIYLGIQLVESLSKFNSPVHAYQIIGKILNTAESNHQKKLNDFEALSQSEKDRRGYSEKLFLERNSKLLKFWQQYYETYLKAKVALGMEKSGDLEVSNQTVNELVHSFQKEVSGRRNRFNPQTMTNTARLLSDTPEFREKGITLFESIIQKLGLLRGNKDVLNPSISHFFESVRDSNLPDEVKDKLLSDLVTTLMPPNNQDLAEMFESIGGLLKIANDVSGDQRFPKTELELLKILDNAASDTEFNRNDSWGNSTKITLLKELFSKITENNPEILHGTNLETFITLSSDHKYLKNISSLLPIEAKEYYSDDVLKDGVFDLNKIKAGFYDSEAVFIQVKVELETTLSSPKLITEKLEHICQVYSELIKQELAKFRSSKESTYIITRDDLLSLTGIKDLFSLIKDKFTDPKAEFDLTEQKIIRIIFDANTAEEAHGKYSLYRDVLGKDEAPITLQRIAFENLLKTDKVTNYVKSYFENKIIGESDEKQKTFYNWINTFLRIGNNRLPKDTIIAALLEKPDQAEEFFSRYMSSINNGLVPEKIDGKNYISPTLHSYVLKSAEDFFDLRDEFIATGNFWLPELQNDIDLELVYEHRFNWVKTYEGFLSLIRQSYINNSFDMTAEYNQGYSFTIPQLQTELQEFIPGFTFTYAEHSQLAKFFGHTTTAGTDRGTIQYSEFIKILTNINLTVDQSNLLRNFLEGGDETDFNAILRIYGRDNLDDEQKKKLAEFLKNAKKEYIEREDKINTIETSTPEIFKEMPEVIRFMLSRYFVQLPFGERQAIMAEFDTQQDMTPEIAIRRFFEVTGTEKVGQFLSTRRDIVPENFRAELERFQQDVEPSSFDEVRRTIEREFEKPIEKVYLSLEEKPLNVGTIGEVYQAVTLDNRKVVIKVITPSKKNMIRLTLIRLEKVCTDLQKNKVRFNVSYNPMAMFEEFKHSMLEELDFRIEYKNAEEIRQDLPDAITIPEYIASLCKESVLTQTYAEGINVKEITDKKLIDEIIDRLGRMLINQFIETGAFHDDLHPGNIRVVPDTKNIELLDFGRIGHASETERKNLMPLLMAIKSKSVDRVIDILATISPTKQSFDRVGLASTLKSAMDNPESGASTIMSRMLFECGNHGLPVNPTYIRMIKAVMTFEGTAMSLDPQFKLETFLQKVGMTKIIGSFKNMAFGFRGKNVLNS